MSIQQWLKRQKCNDDVTAVFDSMYCQTVAATPSQMGLYECAREENAWTYGDGNFRSVLTFNPKFLEKEKGLLNGCLSEVSLHHLYHKQWTALRQSIILTQSFYVLSEVSIEASYRSFTAICLACEHVLSFGIYVTAQLPIKISATAFGKSYCHPVQAWIFSGLIFTTAQVVFITAKVAFMFTPGFTLCVED